MPETEGSLAIVFCNDSEILLAWSFIAVNSANLFSMDLSFLEPFKSFTDSSNAF